MLNGRLTQIISLTSENVTTLGLFLISTQMNKFLHRSIALEELYRTPFDRFDMTKSWVAKRPKTAESKMAPPVDKFVFHQIVTERIIRSLRSQKQSCTTGQHPSTGLCFIEIFKKMRKLSAKKISQLEKMSLTVVSV